MKKLECLRVRINKHELVVVFSDYGSFGRRRQVVIKNKVLAQLNRFYCWVVEVDFDANCELTPARLVNLKRRLTETDQRLWEALIQKEFYFAYVVQRLRRSKVTAPLVRLAIS